MGHIDLARWRDWKSIRESEWFLCKCGMIELWFTSVDLDVVAVDVRKMIISFGCTTKSSE